ncbi:MAG: Holliday junction branch migration protein RuvA [Fibrobacterota bacterium]
MFEFIRGILFSSGTDYAVIDTGSVGYRLGVTAQTSRQLPEHGSEVLLYAYYHVTENSQALFGFISRDERSLFEILLGVNKIGPKVALSILSTLTVSDIVRAVAQDDPSGFNAVSGVGAKTASRLILELKDKLSSYSLLIQESSSPSSPGAQNTIAEENGTESSVKNDAYTALIALGYTDVQIKRVLQKIAPDMDTSDTVESWITKALQVL